MELGDTMTWEARHFGIQLRLTSHSTEFQRPNRFVDEQQHGLFARFRHVHEFLPVADARS